MQLTQKEREQLIDTILSLTPEELALVIRAMALTDTGLSPADAVRIAKGGDAA